VLCPDELVAPPEPDDVATVAPALPAPPVAVAASRLMPPSVVRAPLDFPHPLPMSSAPMASAAQPSMAIRVRMPASLQENGDEEPARLPWRSDRGHQSGARSIFSMGESLSQSLALRA
jgi:hypothetical protein